VEKATLWCLLGEAASKCDHLCGTPLPPALARKFRGVYMVKGAVATTAIEGNTLTEDEVQDLLDQKRKLPPSQQYLQREVENVLTALQRIDDSARAGAPLTVTAEWIQDQNRQVLDGLECEDHVVPGEYTKTRVVAGLYRGAPPEDVDYLVDRLCQWLTEFLGPLHDPETPADMRFFLSFLAATLGHLYIAWIHPFGDGNGRTARLLECAILAHSGVVPLVSSNLLSDFYNRTRTRYYQKLDRASRDGDVPGFIEYSAQGFVDMIREQIDLVKVQQRRIAWVNYVHEMMAMHTTDGPAQKRQRTLVLALTNRPDGAKRSQLRRLTPELAELYAGKTDKTLTRDLNRLRELELVQLVQDKWHARIDLMDAFLPIPVKSE
jgi:Fic family protein